MEDSDPCEDEEGKRGEYNDYEAKESREEENFPFVEIPVFINGSKLVSIWSETNQEFEEFLIHDEISTEFERLAGQTKI